MQYTTSGKVSKVLNRSVFADAATATLALSIIIGIANVPATWAQSATAARPKFEVASIKPCSNSGQESGGRGGGGSSPENWSPGRLNLNCVTVMSLIYSAYGIYAEGKPVPEASLISKTVLLQPKIEGGPAWIRSDRYQISAMAENSPDEATMKGPMMQALLEDRFKLEIHHGKSEVPVYDLTVARSGLKIHRFQGSCTPIDVFAQFAPPEPKPGVTYCQGRNVEKGRNATVDIPAISLDAFCKIVLITMDRPVINKTGLTGLFDFHMVYGADETSSPRFRDGRGVGIQSPDDVPGPSIFTALEEELGLKLVPAKGPGDFLVVDSVEKPSEN